MQTWDPDQYARHARFVSNLGGPVVDYVRLHVAATKPKNRFS